MVLKELVLGGRMVLQGVGFLDIDTLSISTVPMVFLLVFFTGFFVTFWLSCTGHRSCTGSVCFGLKITRMPLESQIL